MIGRSPPIIGELLSLVANRHLWVTSIERRALNRDTKPPIKKNAGIKYRNALASMSATGIQACARVELTAATTGGAAWVAALFGIDATTCSAKCSWSKPKPM